MPPAVRTGLNASAVRLPNRRVLGDSVYEVIKGLVIDQRVEPGSRMNIDSLARQLTVSQTPIREALARLEADGLVIREPLRGYSVAPLLDASSFDQLYDMRLLLEPEAARHAARNIREEDFRPLEKAATAMRKATLGETYKEFSSFSTQDAIFHQTIAAAAGNSFLLDAIVRLRSHLQLSRLYFYRGIPDADEAMPEHEKLIALLRSRSADAAASLMVRHITRSRARLVEILRGLSERDTGSEAR